MTKIADDALSCLIVAALCWTINLVFENIVWRIFCSILITLALVNTAILLHLLIKQEE